MRRVWQAWGLCLWAAGCFGALPALAIAASEPDTAYVAGIRSWQDRRVRNLQSDTGWLTVTGLFWLEDGDNVFGTGLGAISSMPPDRRRRGPVGRHKSGARARARRRLSCASTANRCAPPAASGFAGKPTCRPVRLLSSSSNAKSVRLRMLDRESELRNTFHGMIA